MEARGQEPRQQGPLAVAAWPGSFGDVLRNIRRSGNCRAADPGELALQATLDLVEVLLAVRGAQRVDRAARGDSASSIGLPASLIQSTSWSATVLGTCVAPARCHASTRTTIR